ncbi:hypothetical protein ACF0H5_012353 [Mactra antiquata]
MSDGTGVDIGGEKFKCKYLHQELDNDNHDIYKNRVELCKLSTTDCCATCKDILSCQDHPNGIYLVEMYFDCKYLLKPYPEDRKVGIYKSRNKLCKDTMTKCCHSCAIIKNQSLNSGTSKDRRPTTRMVTTTQHTVLKPPITETHEYIDTCNNHCIWIADGSYGRCSWLTNPLKSVYKTRLTICRQNMAPGCRGTCQSILMEPKTSFTHMPIKTSSTPAPCIDNHLMVDKHSVDCKALLQPKSHVYERRKSLCKLNTTQCCEACKHIHKEQSELHGKRSKASRVRTASRRVPNQRHTSKRLNHHLIDGDNPYDNFLKLYNKFVLKANVFVKGRKEREHKLNRVINKIFRTIFKQFKTL